MQAKNVAILFIKKYIYLLSPGYVHSRIEGLRDTVDL